MCIDFCCMGWFCVCRRSLRRYLRTCTTDSVVEGTGSKTERLCRGVRLWGYGICLDIFSGTIWEFVFCLGLSGSPRSSLYIPVAYSRGCFHREQVDPRALCVCLCVCVNGCLSFVIYRVGTVLFVFRFSFSYFSSLMNMTSTWVVSYDG